MVDQQTEEKYADLALRTGVNLQKGQTLMVNASVECAEFARVVARKAYEMGAKNVQINWADEELTRLKYEYAPEDVLTHVPQWLVDKQMSFAEDGAALLSIASSNPDLLQDVDPERVAKASKASSEALAEFQKYIMNDKITWSIISIPTGDWAQKVFPNDTKEDAVEKLWDAIVNIVRVDKDDPVAAWKEHNETLEKARGVLNDKQYAKMHLRAPGTDLEVEMPKNHIWAGGSAVSQQGVKFNPNMPTEEVFTAPHKYGVNGTVASTKPLNYGGSVIDNFSLTFKDGKVVDYQAEQGQETLKHLLETDDGSKRLGEFALVPDESPISQSGIVFYNTLFDENASCHIALGKAYPTNVEGGTDMSDEELDKHGINDSLNHVDFMIGSAELDIDGFKPDGTTEPVFRNGTWAMDMTGQS